MPVFPAIFQRVAGNLLSVDGSATQLPAILLAILLGVDAPLRDANYVLSSKAAFNILIKAIFYFCRLFYLIS